jgi:hypothetical protein
MIRVYIAGKLNDIACDYVKNLHRMIETANEVRKLGYAVFIPGIDFLAGLQCGDWNYNDYFDNSQPWLDVCDAVYLTPGWETSKGTERELARAREKTIPIFDSTIELTHYFYGEESAV